MDGSRSDSINISSVASSSGGNRTGHDNTPSSVGVLLHGKLDICIVEAQNLPGSRRLHRKFLDKVHDKIAEKREKLPRNRDSKEPSSFKELVRKMSGGFEKRMPHSSEPFVSIWLTKAIIGRTRVIRKSRDPFWKQNFSVLVAHYASVVRFVVENHDIIGAEMTGAVEIPVAEIYSGHLGKVEGNFAVAETGAELRISIQYTPVERLNLKNLGPHFPGIEGAYFPLRKGGAVKLYQDAHVPDGYLPELNLDDGLQYEHGKCWQDISEAIDEAKHLIYIAGWSVYQNVRLQRESNNQQTLGELLLRRSRERVRVVILAWDDPSSWHIFGFNTRGRMNTHDEELRSFFKHTQVNVLLCNRKVAGKEHGLLKKQV